MKHVDIIYVVLVYRRTDILDSFYKSLKNTRSHHVIVVNSYYDDLSWKECKLLARKYSSDFINIPNKGYGYGNNIGIKYALEHYSFDYLIVSNSDIIVEKIEIEDDCYKNKMCVIAPDITTLSGKKQNPNITYFFKPLYYLLHLGYKRNCKVFITISHVYTRLSREYALLKLKFTISIRTKIYCPHGAFIIFTNSAIRKLFPIFNDEMFLYNEESFLASKAKINQVPVIWDTRICVKHLEGASSSSNMSIAYSFNKASYEVLYNYMKNNNII